MASRRFTTQDVLDKLNHDPDSDENDFCDDDDDDEEVENLFERLLF